MKTTPIHPNRHHRLAVAASVAAGIALIAGSTASFVVHQRSTARQRMATEARTRAEETLGYVLARTHPHLGSLGKSEALLDATIAAVGHFEQLPAELLNTATQRTHARALYLLMRCYGFPGRNRITQWPEFQDVLQKALPLWRTIASDEPSDGEAAARVHHLAWFAGAFTTAEDRQSLGELERRYPGNRVVQLYLGHRAVDMARHGAEHGRESESLEYATRRLRSLDRHLAQYPHDSEVRTLRAELLGGLAAAYEHTGQRIMSARFIQRATTEIESVLGRFPSDLEALSLSIGLAIKDLNVTMADHVRFSSMIDRTRCRLQLLRSLNPDNQDWLASEAQLAHLESIVSFRIGDLDGARIQEEKTLALAMSMDPANGRRCKMVDGAFLTLGTIEHLAGNRSAALARVIQLQEVIRRLRANPALGEPLQEWEAMLTLAILHTRMNNYAELERVARELLASESRFAELTLYDRDWHAYQRELRKAIAHGLHGRALFGLGQPENAIGPLEIFVTRFRNRPSTAPHSMVSPQLILENAVCLGRAHDQCGNTARALEVLEWAYEGYRNFLPERGDWFDLLGAADSAWHLVDSLDGDSMDQTVRIYEVLTQANHWLDQSATVRPLGHGHLDLCIQIETKRRSMNRFSGAYLATYQPDACICR